MKKYVNPSKIAKERTIFEVSQLRLLSQISYYVNEDLDISHEMAELNRLVKRGEQIKKAGGYKSLPTKVNQYLRYQEALIQGKFLTNKASNFNDVMQQGSISYLSSEYDYFTKQLSIAEAKIGKVPGQENREKLNRTYTKPAKISKERTIYEVSQFRLLETAKSLYHSGQEYKAKESLKKLDRMKKRAAAIKSSGGYKALPSALISDLESTEEWVRYLVEGQ